jgi:hypothetical protein
MARPENGFRSCNHTCWRGGDLVHRFFLVYLVSLVGNETNQINQTIQINCLQSPLTSHNVPSLQSDGYAIDFEVDSPSQFAETVWPINS